MYKVFCDNLPLYNYKLSRYKISDALLELELNKTGSFDFLIFSNHENYSAIRKMRSIIRIYQDDYLLFRGRVLNTEEGFYNERQVVCEGELAFLFDSVIEPEGTEDSPVITTPRQYLTNLIAKHNARMGDDDWKKFSVGVVDLGKDEDGNPIADKEIKVYATDYKKTLDLINENLIDVLGGYLWITDGDDMRCINYYADFNSLSNQTIELSKNLLDLKKISKGEELATAIIPVGGGSDEKITIAELTDGEVGKTVFEGQSAAIIKKGDHLYCDKAVEKYGWIFQAVTFEESDAEALQKAAAKDLADKINMSSTIGLTAADLAGIKKGVDPFRLGVKIKAKSAPHGLETIETESGFLVKKLSINILNPAANKLTINDTFLTYTQEIEKSLKSQAAVGERVKKIENDVAGYVTKEEQASAIKQSAEAITTKIAESYYLKSDAEKLVESVNTQFTQTNDKFEFQFNEFNQNLSDVETNVNAQFSDISKYIRFVDGNIILGESGNELILRIENDRISFLDAGAEVAYFSNNQLTVLDGSFLNSLRIGKFAFIPRQNGNLSLVKVG